MTRIESLQPEKEAGNNILVSVIMPTYNYGDHISKSIDSALNQTHTNCELIIIDNYSDDNTEEVVSSYQDDRIKYLKIHNNGIVAASSNYGIRESKGSLIAFLDSDDCWYLNKLEEVVRYFDQNKDVDLICHDENWVFAGSNEESKRVSYGPWNSHEDLLFKGNRISISAVAVRKEKLLISELFSERDDFKPIDDYELWLQLSRFCKIKFLHKVLGEYTVHTTSLSFTITIESKLQSTFNVVKHHYDKLGKKGSYYRYLLKKRESDLHRETSSDLFQRGEIKLSKKYALSSLKIFLFNIRAWFLLLKCIIKMYKS